MPHSTEDSQLAGHRLDADLLRPSGALLGAHIALSAAIETHAVDVTGHHPTTLDLLTRLSLAPGNQLRAVELCRQLRLSPSHVSRMLDRAEAAELVRRAPDPDDRRAHQVVMTDGGWEVVRRFGPRLEELLTEVIFNTLTTEEIETLVATLDKVEMAATQYSGPDDTE